MTPKNERMSPENLNHIAKGREHVFQATFCQGRAVTLPETNIATAIAPANGWSGQKTYFQVRTVNFKEGI